MNKSEVIAEFLSKISGDIEMIDGGCRSCIEEFCDGVNESLVEYSIRLVYTEDYPIKVNIITGF